MQLDSYEILLFLHILGAMGLFAGLAIEAVAVTRLARANGVQQVRDWLATSAIGVWTSIVSMVILLLAGLVMMAVRWGPTSWTITALIALVVMALISQIVSRRRLSELRRHLRQGTDAELLGGLSMRAPDSHLSVSVWLRIGVVVGTLELMTTKPDVLAGVLILVIAALLGAGVGMLLARQSSPKAEQPSVAA
jgi:ABC-type multidrug transport system fused ATPase/permease subunit